MFYLDNSIICLFLHHNIADVFFEKKLLKYLVVTKIVHIFAVVKTTNQFCLDRVSSWESGDLKNNPHFSFCFIWKLTKLYIPLYSLNQLITRL